MGNEPRSGKPTMKKMLVEIPVGATLTPSKKVPGASSPLVHGPDGVTSQAVLHEIPSKMTKFASSGFAEFLLNLFKQYLADRHAAAKKIAPAHKENADSVAVAETSDPGDDVVETGPSLTSDQWYQLFFDAVAHGVAGNLHQQISTEKWRQLAGAPVDDDPATQELARSMHELTPEEISAGVDHVLVEHPELRDEDPILVLRLLFDDDARPTMPQPLDLDEGEEEDQTRSGENGA